MIRDGVVEYRSPVQLHDTDHPFQLGVTAKLDDPSCAEVSAFSFSIKYVSLMRVEDLHNAMSYLATGTCIY